MKILKSLCLSLAVVAVAGLLLSAPVQASFEDDLNYLKRRCPDYEFNFYPDGRVKFASRTTNAFHEFNLRDIGSVTMTPSGDFELRCASGGICMKDHGAVRDEANTDWAYLICRQGDNRSLSILRDIVENPSMVIGDDSSPAASNAYGSEVAGVEAAQQTVPQASSCVRLQDSPDGGRGAGPWYPGYRFINGCSHEVHVRWRHNIGMAQVRCSTTHARNLRPGASYAVNAGPLPRSETSKIRWCADYADSEIENLTGYKTCIASNQPTCP